MRTITEKYLTLAIILIFLGTLVIPSTNGDHQRSYLIPNTNNTEQELDLLHGEVLFYIEPLDNLNEPFNITLAIPPNYENQAPILIDIRDDTTADIISYKIVNDTNQPNKIIKLEIGPINTEEKPSLHFDFWVLVKNEDYSDLPSYVKIPKKSELPEETKTWLVSTKAIQSDNILIKCKAHQLRRFTFGNLNRLADKIVFFTKIHAYRPFMSLFHLCGHDALSCFLLTGQCTGLANLGTALFRANGVPAKDLIVMPCFLDKWIYMHWISEYYCPEYGWILAETSWNINPHQPKNNIILRVNYPEDENEAGNKFSRGYGGLEPWYWMPKTVYPLMDYKNKSSGTRACIEKELITDNRIANLAFNLTWDVYELHTKYFGINLIGDNKIHFDNAISAQQNAIECFNQLNVVGYYDNMTTAYNEYLEIECP